jgi:hypothetical protein
MAEELSAKGTAAVTLAGRGAASEGTVESKSETGALTMKRVADGTPISLDLTEMTGNGIGIELVIETGIGTGTGCRATEQLAIELQTWTNIGKQAAAKGLRPMHTSARLRP